MRRRDFISALALTLASNTAEAGDFNGPANGGALVSQVIMQCHLPFIVPSSGTMGNNGALSGITALPNTYPAAYIYMPAGAISASSAAGFYYFVGSSTTAGTVYNNLYGGQNCYTFASPTPFVTTGPGAYTQTTAANIFGPRITIGGGTLGVNGTIRVEGLMLNNNSATTKQYRGYIGNYNFSISQQTTNVMDGIYGGFSNRGVANQQTPLTNSQAFSPIQTGGPPSFGVIDTTVAQTVQFGVVLNAATDYEVMENVVFTLLPGN